MSKIVLINGSCHEKGNTYIALNELKTELEKNGIGTELIWLGTGPVQDCVACHSCADTGKCAFETDEVNRLLSELDDISGFVIGSPIYFGGPSGRLCSFLDRLFFASFGRMSGKIGAAVVSCRRGGATAGFDRLNNYFLMSNMIVPASQYWNQVHGAAPGEALQDAEGLQTMRTLATNIAWILSNIAESETPTYERKIATNFIR